MMYNLDMHRTLKNLSVVLFVASSFVVFQAGNVVAEEIPVTLPPGFVIKRVAGNDLVPDASCMTVDNAGQPVVSGPGYIRRLFDDDKDGVYDRSETIANIRGVAQGLFFDGEKLLITADRRLAESTGERNADGTLKFRTITFITTDHEHGAHAIRKGRDGWYYVLCGNATELRPEFSALATSPIRSPRAGFLMRFPPQSADDTPATFQAEIVCHGFRNAYDFDFDQAGNIYVYDSDGERDVSLPWYRPTRIFRVQPGDDAGWVSASWKRPASFFDMPELIGELGRGSPTGVAVCDRAEFGVEFEQSVFVADWTFGRIGVARRFPDSAAFDDVEIFASPQGQFGFAITDLVFAPDGSLLVSTGGRGTEGAVYRISKKQSSGMTVQSPATSNVRSAKLDLPESASLSTASDDVLIETAMVIADLSRQAMADDRTLRVLRRFTDSIADQPALREKLLSKTDESIRPFIEPPRRFEPSSPERIQLLLKMADRVVATENSNQRARQIRVMQLFLGGCDGNRMFAGHTAAGPIKLDAAQSKHLAALMKVLLLDANNAFEIARLAGMLRLGDVELSDQLLAIAENDPDPVTRIHWLNCLAMLDRETWSDESANSIAGILLQLKRELIAQGRPIDRNWEPRMEQLAAKLCESDLIAKATVNDSRFGNASNVWLFRSLPAAHHAAARKQIANSIENSIKNDSAATTAQQLNCLVGDGNYDSLIRSFSNQAQFVDIVVRAVALAPLPADETLLINGLSSNAVATRKTAAIALRRLNIDSPTQQQIAAVVEAIVRLNWSDPEISVRDQLMLLLETWTSTKTKYQPRQYRPDPATLASQQSAVNELRALLVRRGLVPKKAAAAVDSQARFAKIDFSSGDVQRGRVVYARLQCAACHEQGGRNSGPQLGGIAGRFSRSDIFRSITHPNEIVPQRYRATLIETADGNLLKGSIVYESTDGIMLANETGEVIRVPSTDVENRRVSDLSLMPSGLLDQASDSEVADLWAYLQQLN